MLDRRDFLRSVLAGVAGLTLDVDKLLWVPGAKTIFLPPTKTFQGGVVTSEWILKEAARLFSGKLAYPTCVSSRGYPSVVGDDGMTDQFHVDTLMRPALTHDQVSRQLIEPAMEALVGAVHRVGGHTFGVLPVGRGVEFGGVASDASMSLRMIRDYSVEYASEVVRFDVLTRRA